jgi:hypothetical protein
MINIGIKISMDIRLAKITCVLLILFCSGCKNNINEINMKIGAAI